jgi:hypothetical protein
MGRDYFLLASLQGPIEILSDNDVLRNERREMY